jgi:uncharacterized protein (DUF2267 family)
MTATGLDVFDKTLQTTNIWLDELMGEIGPPRQGAWHALGAVLRALRDRLPIELGAHLGAQLPLLVRGLYYDQFQPARIPERLRTEEEFLSRVSDDLSGTRPVDARDAVRAVCAVLNRHVTPELVEKVKDALPEAVRRLWPAPGEVGLGAHAAGR